MAQGTLRLHLELPEASSCCGPSPSILGGQAASWGQEFLQPFMKYISTSTTLLYLRTAAVMARMQCSLNAPAFTLPHTSTSTL